MLKSLRSRRFWTLAILFLALMIGSVWSSSAFHKCVQDHQPQAADQKTEEGIAAFFAPAVPYRDCLAEFLHDNGEAVLAVFTIVLALSTIALWLATGDVVTSAERTGRERLAHGQEVNRAYLTGGGDVENGQRQSFRVEVANHGRTTAFLRAFDIHFAALADLRTEIVARPVTPARRLRDQVSPGGITRVIDVVPISNANADIVYGAFYYDDIWRERVHTFRFILSIRQDETGRWRARSDVDVSRLADGYADWD